MPVRALGYISAAELMRGAPLAFDELEPSRVCAQSAPLRVSFGTPRAYRFHALLAPASQPIERVRASGCNEPMGGRVINPLGRRRGAAFLGSHYTGKKSHH